MKLVDNLILLAAAALVTGLLVPFVSARMNERRLIQRRQAEEDLVRDSKFIEAQTSFLDGLSTDLWRLAGTILGVSYYATQSREQFAEAWRVYDASAFDELFALRGVERFVGDLLQRFRDRSGFALPQSQRRRRLARSRHRRDEFRRQRVHAAALKGSFDARHRFRFGVFAGKGIE